MTTLQAATQYATEYHGHGGWWVFAPLLWIGFFILFFGVLRGFFWRRHRHNFHSHSARSVLAERFAKGEIDETEYRQRLSVLDPPRK